MSSNIKSASVNVYMDSQAAEAGLKRLQLQSDLLSKSIQDGQAQGKKMVAELTKFDKVQDNIKKVQAQLDSGLKPSLMQQTQLVTQLRNEMNRFTGSDADLKKLGENYKLQSQYLQQLKDRITSVSATQQKLNENASSMGKVLDSSFASFFRNIIASASAFIGIQSIFGFLQKSLEKFEGADVSIQRQQNALHNLGASVADIKLLSGSITELTDKYKYLSKVDLRESQQKLVTYGKLTAEQIKALEPTIVNLAANARISISDATDDVIKAMEGRAGALKVYGINIKDSKTESEKFNLIQTTLAGKVAGSAQVFQDSSEGKIATYQKTLGALQVQIGEQLMPVYESFLDKTISLGNALKSINFANIIKGITALAVGWVAYRTYLLAANVVTVIQNSLLIANTAVTTGNSVAKAAAAVTENARAIAVGRGATAEAAQGVVVKGNTVLTYAIIAAKKAYAAVTNVATGAVQLFNIAMRATPIGAIIGALAALVAVIFGAVKVYGAFNSSLKDHNNAAKEGAERNKLLNDSQAEAGKSMADNRKAIDELTSKIKDHNIGLNNRKKALNDLIQLDPSYLKGLTLQNVETATGKKIIDDYVAALTRKAQAEALEQKLTENYGKETDIKAGKGTEPTMMQKVGNFLTSEINLAATGAAISYSTNNAITEENNKNEQLKKVLSERTIITQELGKLGTSDATFNQTSGVGKYGDPNTDKNAQKKYEEERKAILKEIEELHFEAAEAAKTADQQEIDRVAKKYDDLIKRAKAHAVDTAKLILDEANEISALRAKQDEEEKKKTDQEAQKEADDNYQAALKDNDLRYQMQKDAAAKRFIDGVTSKKQYEQQIKEIDAESADEQVKTAIFMSDSSKKAAEDVTKFKTEQLKEQAAAAIAAAEKIEQNNEKEKKAAAELGGLKATNPDEKLAAQKAQLALEEQLELSNLDKDVSNTESAENQKAVIRKKYEDKQKELDKQYYDEKTSQDLSYVQYTLDLASKLNGLLNSNDQSRINQIQKNSDQQKKVLDQQLKSHLISQQSYNKTVTDMDTANDNKKRDLEIKQFRRKQALDFANGLINAAQAIEKTIAQHGPPLPDDPEAMLAMAMTIGTNAVELGVIASTKPSFAGGGRVDHVNAGKITAQQNAPALPNGDNILAYVKHGEVILNQQQQAALGGANTFASIGVPGFASGGRVSPFWATRPYQYFNYPLINHSVRGYASGGAVVTENLSPTLGGALTDISEMLSSTAQMHSQLNDTLAQLQQQLSNPIQSYVVLKQITDATTTRSRIIANAALNQ